MESHTENVTFKVFCLHNKDTGDFSMEKNCRNVFLGLSEKFDTFLILLLDSRLFYYSILLRNIHFLSFTLLFKVLYPFFLQKNI